MILRAQERCLRCSHKCCNCLGSGVDSLDQPTFAIMQATGTAATPAFDVAAGRTLPAENFETSMPDMQSIVRTQRAIVSLATDSWGFMKLMRSQASVCISPFLSSLVASMYFSKVVQTHNLGSLG
ncbi:hypothetical protein E2C01_064065 [Portunus trituberculatus]|uniref:Uncharacterized protein n=1 Tax=Portunus trituberculatus TaxID=210409 RepID=A0A5B7HI36_PORTR|nr:hypothetical protein [Portunus trituberculatus]